MFLAWNDYLTIILRARISLYGRRSKGKGKGIRAQDHARGRREEGNACKEAIVFATRPTNLKNNKNNAIVNDSNKSGRNVSILVVFLALFFFCFPKTRNLK